MNNNNHTHTHTVEFQGPTSCLAGAREAESRHSLLGHSCPPQQCVLPTQTEVEGVPSGRGICDCS